MLSWSVNYELQVLGVPNANFLSPTIVKPQSIRPKVSSVKPQILGEQHPWLPYGKRLRWRFVDWRRCKDRLSLS